VGALLSTSTPPATISSAPMMIAAIGIVVPNSSI
jgi:hypothetical protein